MSWALLFRARQRVKSSLWLVPLLGGIGGVLLGALVGESDAVVPDGWDYSASTAESVLTTIVGSTVALTGFVVTVSVLVVQMATGTFSARYMRLWYRDPLLKGVLAALVFTFAFSFALLRRVETDSVPDLGITLAGFFIGASMLLFLLFLDRIVRGLRPVAVAAKVARAGQRAMTETVEAATRYGRQIGPWLPPAGSRTLVVRADRSGAIQALDIGGLIAIAQRENAVLLLPHAVGDFVSTGTVLVEVYGGEGVLREEARLRRMMALGVERSIEQDPAFALRIMVDIANRALSAAVNDPSTAVQVLNHLENTLAVIGSVPHLEGQWTFHGPDGQMRVLIPAHRWDDYLSLAVTEIRLYGGGAIQVVRRMRALLEQLRESVLPEYVAAVEDELTRLDAVVEQRFGGYVDIDRARDSDRQGIGGPPHLPVTSLLREDGRVRMSAAGGAIPTRRASPRCATS